MTQEEKDLLIKDLCSRLPYGVKVHAKYTDLGETIEVDGKVVTIDIDGVVGIELMYDTSSERTYVQIDDVKPYLFPLSSMTKEQCNKWYNLGENPLDEILVLNERGVKMSTLEHHLLVAKSSYDPINYCYENHFDVHGLVSIRLANDATNLNIY